MYVVVYVRNGMLVHSYVCMCVCVYVQSLCGSNYMRMNLCKCMCMYVCMCVCMYVVQRKWSAESRKAR